MPYFLGHASLVLRFPLQFVIFYAFFYILFLITPFPIIISTYIYRYIYTSLVSILLVCTADKKRFVAVPTTAELLLKHCQLRAKKNYFYNFDC